MALECVPLNSPGSLPAHPLVWNCIGGTMGLCGGIGGGGVGGGVPPPAGPPLGGGGIPGCNGINGVTALATGLSTGYCIAG